MSIKFYYFDHILLSISEVKKAKEDERVKTEIEDEETPHKVAPSEDELLDVSPTFYLDFWSSMISLRVVFSSRESEQD